MIAHRQIRLAVHAGSLTSGFSRQAHPTRKAYDLTALVEAAQLFEAAKFDFIIEPDAVLFDVDTTTTVYGGTKFHADATAVVASVAAATSRIGLVTTATTTFNVPYALARQLLTLDHLTGGRVGWNAVTSFGGERQFGFDELPDQDTRYRRADEFVDLVQQLWEGWAPDAVTADPNGATRVDHSKIKKLKFHGELLHSEGALGIPRSPQGRPVQFQAGASDGGLQFAGKYAEAIYAASPDLDHALGYASRLAEATARYRPGAPRPLIFPGADLILGASEAEAKERERALVERLDFEAGRSSLALTFGATVAKDSTNGLGVDLSDLDLDEPIPAERIERLPDTSTLRRRQSRAGLYRGLALSGLTLREVIVHHLQGHGHFRFTGTYDQVAEEFARWFEAGAVDGFAVAFTEGARGARDFVEHVVPRLQDRGLFRREYAGTTLRENLGLPVRELVGQV